uniref:RNA-dependent RNA polymerase n=1 Tax=Papaya meleira virus 2 TaxID=1824957 RepID=A0A172JTY3_9VIRU|nr:RNA-dependent RNA polymerase [Papaya meleira virus 2]
MNNLLRGFCTRVWRYKGSDPIAPSRLKMPRFERKFRAFQVSRWTRDMVVDNALPRRRALFRKAADSLEASPITCRDSNVYTFIKAEKFDYLAKPDADPRLIQPRSERYMVEHGTFMKAVEKPVYSCLARLQGGLPMVAKGFNAQETARILRAKWDKFRDPVCISLDASRFDQHVSVAMLKFTHRIYRRFFASPLDKQELSKLCQWQLSNAGRARCREGTFKYQVAGRRMSGDMDTSLGNCLIMCAITYELFCRNHYCEIFNNGDDCLVISERAHLPTAAEVCSFYRDYGFHVVEEERVDVFERISFCQTSPVWAGGRWVMCRGLRAMVKDLTYIGPKSALPLWLDAIGQCGAALCDGVPIFSRFYSTLMKPGLKQNKIRNSMLYSCGMTRLSEGMSFQGLAVSDLARLSFMRAFGINPCAQIAIEESMSDYSGLENQSNRGFCALSSCETLLSYMLRHGRFEAPDVCAFATES